MERVFSLQEISQHNTKDDLWIVLHGKVYDLTKFLPNHPGGQNVILKHSGKDATLTFELYHSTDIIDRFLPPEMYIGQVEQAYGIIPSNKSDENQEQQQETQEEKRIQLARETMPPIEEMFNTFDFQSVARHVLKESAFAYFSSGSGDDMTMRENHNAYHRIWFRPRVMVNVSHIDMTTEMLGAQVSFPLYISATSFCKMAHPEGEKVLARAAGKQGIIQMIPTLASCSLNEIVDARVYPTQLQWLQLYINTDRQMTQRMIQQAESEGVKGLFITVDRAIVGPRGKSANDKDMFEDQGGMEKVLNHERGTGSKTLPSFVDPSMNWKDMAWFKSITKMPIVLKGIQRWEDAVLAWRHGCAGIVLSNHGGRQLDFSPSPIEILPEVIDALKREGCDPSKDFEVYVDGGIRRGSDIFKAIALGAKGVGIGRPALYALGCYGEKGVEYLLNLFKTELAMCMRLMGAPTIKDIQSDMVDTRNLKNHYVANPIDYLAKTTYERLQPRGNLSKL
ncbi:FMN-dependent dehydrogenase-domain-containing protein [Phascolomyces articulosus]|uniref:L-lactate dehydrogenase (cytochrome) n=1 Tax=Phascolomyces articulosus TaxID=60185 RepID=A0AAD5KCG2_9FUNG|nr:FMN-dependent dehydrogenase-domain-containing protein [Phascolomyces articulosus]